MTKDERIDKLIGAIFEFLEENEKPFVIDEDELYKVETFLSDYDDGRNHKKNICRCLEIDKFSQSEYKNAVDVILENVGCEYIMNPAFGCERETLIVIGG